MIAGIELVARPGDKGTVPGRPADGQGGLPGARGTGTLLRPLGNVIVLMPPLAIDEPLLDRLCAIVHESIAEVCGQAR